MPETPAGSVQLRLPVVESAQPEYRARLWNQEPRKGNHDARP